MSTATHTTHPAHTAGESHRSARQLHDDIRHTRHEMDETLDELGERLHPRHLLDDLIELFQGGDGVSRGRQVADTARHAGQSAIDAIREHPMAALLIAAGLGWWIFDDVTADDGRGETDWDALGAYSAGGRPDIRLREDPAAYERQWQREVMPWNEHYQWQDETEESWSERAQQTFSELRESLGQQGTSAQQKIQQAARKLMSLSGRKREEIHARWADLREHSGSFVDARTGQPYDDSYAREWENLVAMEAITSSEPREEEEATSSSMASETLHKLQSILADTGSSTRDIAHRAAALIGEYGRSTGHSLKDFGSAVSRTASEWGRSAGEKLSAAGAAGGRAARAAGQGTRRGAAVAQRQFRQGLVSVRERSAEAVDEYPLAVGAACFGLGLIGGLLLPRSEYEDELMGEASDELKSQVTSTGAEAYRRGKEVASATAAAAMEEAERQGLMPDQLAGQAGEAASGTRDAVREAADSAESTAHDLGERLKAVAHTATETAREHTEQEKNKLTS